VVRTSDRRSFHLTESVHPKSLELRRRCLSSLRGPMCLEIFIV